MTKKETIRNSLLKQRTQLSVDEMNRLSNLICDRFISHEMPSYQRVASYLPTKHEVNTLPIHDYLFQNKIPVYVPTYFDFKYHFVEISKQTQYKPGQYNILEPLNSSSAQLMSHDSGNTLWLIPGIAFSIDGHRIGFGKGIYDQLLKEAQGIKCGLCYDFQIQDSWVADTWDIQMNMSITDKQILLFS